MKNMLSKAPRALISIATLTVFAAPTHAQSSVTVYGRVDLGLQYTNKSANAATPAGNAGHLSEVYNGGISPSILGFKGTEDLGSGLKAFFNLETHLSADTGATTTNFFRRQANVGLMADWGKVTLGRQYTPAVLALAATDPRGIKEQMSGLYALALNNNSSTAVNSGNDLGIFMSNAISYVTTVGPVNIGAAYGMGEQAGKRSAGEIISLGGTYTGPVTVSAYFHQNQNAAVTGAAEGKFSRQYGLGLAVPIADQIKIKGQYIKSKVNSGTDSSVEAANTHTWGFGADYAWDSHNTATIAYYQGKNTVISDDTTNTFIISDDYALSKRTTLYAQMAFVKAKAGATGFTSVVSNAVLPNASRAIIGVGISHNF